MDQEILRMKIKENVKNINLKWIYIITGTFLMAIAYKSIYDSAGSFLVARTL